jgi:hypothetical protein
VIGANSVVVGVMPPYAIVVGAPGKVVRRRVEWHPPEELDATDARSIPYLLSGFRIRFANLPDDPIVADIVGRACVALSRPQVGRCLVVAILVDRPVTMQIGAGPPRRIEVGRSEVSVEVPAGDGEEFELLLSPETETLAAGAVQLLGVSLAPPPQR